MKQTENWHLTDLVSHEQGRGDPFAAAVRATRMPMVITDPGQDDNPIVFVNEAFQKLTGYDREEIIGRNCRFLQGPDTDPVSVERIAVAIKSGESVDVDLLNYRKDGTTFWNALYISPVRDGDDSVRYFFASQMNVTDRVEAQNLIRHQKAIVEEEVAKRTRDLAEALEARTLLLHEVDHRVKNNLLMIGSLIRLQTRSITDKDVVDKLHAMLERVDALATVHRRLYQSDDLARFDIGAFADILSADVLGASGRSDIVLERDISEVLVPANAASSFGLVLNELIVNAIKHGFPHDRSGTLHLSVSHDGTTGTVVVADDGVGIPADGVTDGLGRTLVRRMSRQLGGTVDWQPLAPGTRVVLSFPLAG